MSYPVPTKVKEIRGTDQPCRIVENEPAPPGVPEIDAPDWMTEAQQTTWRNTLAACPPDLLRRIDTAVLTQFVIAYSLYVECAQRVAKEGYEVRGHRGARLVSPAVHTMNSQSVIVRQCIQELGFSPASRTRINTQSEVPGGGDGTDEWSQLAMHY